MIDPLFAVFCRVAGGHHPGSLSWRLTGWNKPYGQDFIESRGDSHQPRRVRKTGVILSGRTFPGPGGGFVQQSPQCLFLQLGVFRDQRASGG